MIVCGCVCILQIPSNIKHLCALLPALVGGSLDDEGEAAAAGAVHLEVVVAAVPDQRAVRAQPQRVTPRARPLRVVALPVPV